MRLAIFLSQNRDQDVYLDQGWAETLKNSILIVKEKKNDKMSSHDFKLSFSISFYFEQIIFCFLWFFFFIKKIQIFGMSLRYGDNVIQLL